MMEHSLGILHFSLYIKNEKMNSNFSKENNDSNLKKRMQSDEIVKKKLHYFPWYLVCPPNHHSKWIHGSKVPHFSPYKVKCVK